MDRHATPPFMLRLFYRTGAFHRPDEFITFPLPPHITIHTWPDCNLKELSYIIAAAKPALLPDPAIGTRLAFRLIFPDTRSNASGQTTARYMVKELGSVVVGDGGRGLDPADVDAERTLENDGEKTLGDARFVVGDYISCAILPPLDDGSVAPSTSARMGRGAGTGESRAVVGRAPSSGYGGREWERERERENGHGRPGRGRNNGLGGGNRGGIPMGEWRRGERLPDPPAAGGRGGRGRGRY
ncbi:Sin3 associated polypeptide p18-domain-containing protein [Hypoxylon rubiginosum]|uniref:Sin3 associated polypeptide p18-domain-containing protein n=1 Tax=Hypoxylon rubiginosum TaxID=110542 RepID=A0ACC0CR16_9PEZI|nr:Sin3 associated polypeptide p18-domain-containing protein [Hypoxylon rubiginosum]